jgi:RHS repeat-associated protein
VLNQRTTNVYDVAGRLSATVDNLGQRATYTYDAAGRQVSTTDPAGYVATAHYDVAGQVTASEDQLGQRTSVTYDAAGRQVQIENALGQLSSIIYDAGGRLEASVNSLGQRTSFTYDAVRRRIAVTDANGNVTSTIYDAAGRAEAVENALGYRTSFLYDAAGRRTALENANGQRATFAYDAAGQLTAETDPLDRRMTYTFDAAGRKESMLDPRGVRLTYTYDKGSRVTELEYSDDSRITYTYNGDNRTRVKDLTGEYHTVYDKINRVRRVTQPNGKIVTYTYDARSLRARLDDPDGGITNYGRDAAGRLTYLVNPEGERTTYTYDALGRTTEVVMGNGTKTTYGYDAAGRIEMLTNARSNDSVISRFEYAYDAVGNRVAMETASARNTFTYDATYQLTGETNPAGLNDPYDFMYDGVGNRLTKVQHGVVDSTTTYTYDVANQLESIEEMAGARTTYTFDAAGNQTIVENETGALTTHTWDARNRLVHMIGASQTPVTHVYNANDLRVEQQRPTETIRYVWDGANVLVEADETDATQATYTQTPDGYGNTISQKRDTQRRYYHFDALGSTDALTDDTETVTDTYEYLAFGEVNGDKDNLTKNPYQYVGQLGYQTYHIDDNAYPPYFVRARHYDPITGRWLSQDPFGIGDDNANLWSYVSNRSLLDVDASGLRPKETKFAFVPNAVLYTVFPPFADPTRPKEAAANMIVDWRAVPLMFVSTKKVSDDKYFGCELCHLLGVMQIVKGTATYDKPKISDKVSFFWKIDQGRIYPNAPGNNTIEHPCWKPAIGSGRTAQFQDNPGALISYRWARLLRWKHEFEFHFACQEGPEEGVTYGGVQWRYEFNIKPASLAKTGSQLQQSDYVFTQYAAALSKLPSPLWQRIWDEN